MLCVYVCVIVWLNTPSSVDVHRDFFRASRGGDLEEIKKLEKDVFVNKRTKVGANILFLNVHSH